MPEQAGNNQDKKNRYSNLCPAFHKIPLSLDTVTKVGFSARQMKVLFCSPKEAVKRCFEFQAGWKPALLYRILAF